MNIKNLSAGSAVMPDAVVSMVTAVAPNKSETTQVSVVKMVSLPNDEGKFTNGRNNIG